MKKIILILFIPFLSFSQNQKSYDRIIMDSFVENFNSGKYEAMYSMFSENLKNDVEEKVVKDFFTETKATNGDIKNVDFIEYKKGFSGEIRIGIINRLKLSKSNFQLASYKINFEKQILKIDIGIDNNQMIDEISIDPFIDQTISENAFNNLSLKKNLINEKQTSLIFNKTKYLPNNTQIAIAFIKNGNVSYYGFKRKNDSISTVDNSKNIFEIGSISKVFTSNILANFIINKKLNVEDNVGDYINLKDLDLPISFESLANHSSGLPRMPNNFIISSKKNPLNPYKEYTIDDFETYLADSLIINQDTKGKFLYSNLGFALIGYTLSKIDNQNYKSMFDSYIFSKYNMINTTFDRDEVNDLLIKGLNPLGYEVPNWDLQIFNPAGGVLSNVEDMSKYVVAQFDSTNKELKLLRKQTSRINISMGMGLGWFIIRPKSNKKRMYRHGGNTGGYSSMMIVDVNNKNGIVLLSNVTAWSPYVQNINNLASALMKSLGNK